MIRTNEPQRCPRCNSDDILPKGYDALAKRRGKNNAIYECRSCNNTFSDSTLKREEQKRKLLD